MGLLDLFLPARYKPARTLHLTERTAPKTTATASVPAPTFIQGRSHQELPVTHHQRIHVRLAASLAAAAGLSLLGGCSSMGGKQHASISDDATPSLITLDQRPIDVSNTTTISWNTNWREHWNDWDKIWLLDRPSRLTQFPIPH